jgi:hypothetical protein
MSQSVTLATAAQAAAQFLHVLDSGESLSTQQVADALAAANNLLDSWWQEQNLAMQEFIIGQAKAGAAMAAAYSLAAGTYTAPTWAAGSVPQFSNSTTPLTLPDAYPRALTLGLAIELAPQYDMIPSEALLKQYTEARAAANPMPGKLPVPGMSAASEAPGS